MDIEEFKPVKFKVSKSLRDLYVLRMLSNDNFLNVGENPTLKDFILNNTTHNVGGPDGVVHHKWKNWNEVCEVLFSYDISTCRSWNGERLLRSLIRKYGYMTRMTEVACRMVEDSSDTICKVELDKTTDEAIILSDNNYILDINNPIIVRKSKDKNWRNLKIKNLMDNGLFPKIIYENKDVDVENMSIAEFLVLWNLTNFSFSIISR